MKNFWRDFFDTNLKEKKKKTELKMKQWQIRVVRVFYYNYKRVVI